MIRAIILSILVIFIQCLIFNDIFAGIPIIQSFSSIIEDAVEKCFELTDVQNAFVSASQFIENKFEAGQCKHKPDVHSDFWLTKFNYLTYFLEQSDPYTDANHEMLVTTIRTIIDSLTPLKV